MSYTFISYSQLTTDNPGISLDDPHLYTSQTPCVVDTVAVAVVAVVAVAVATVT